MPQPTKSILDAATAAAKGNTLNHCALNIEMPVNVVGKRVAVEVLCKDAHALDFIAEAMMQGGRVRICDLMDPFSTLIHTYKNPAAK